MIRRATPQDYTWIVDLGAEVYRDFGDYGRILPSWLNHPGVLTFVETDAEQTRRGFILLGFYSPEGSEGCFVADLLAIAVAPPYQRHGIGRSLLQYALELARLANEQTPVSEVRLTVADTNERARRLFESCGFEVLDANHGSYDGGQRAIRMRCRVRPAAGDPAGKSRPA